MLAAMKDSDLVAQGAEPTDRVWSSESRASKDQNAHSG
jgi:hypothetical protein